ncbi:MAG TPA: hypothetical protein VH855_06760 [Acetobacteraceae bacterium]|jgi:hypothetical protein
MARTIDLPAAGYRYIPFAFQYSGGVEALPGYRIERVEFSRPLPLAAGFTWIENYLVRLGVPLLGFCACELRSPEQFTDQGFIDFNRHYTGTLLRWGVMKNPDDNPVARSNVIPELHKPPEPSFHAFCFARRADGGAGSFVIAGSGEAGDEPVPYERKTIRFGETGADAMREKAVFVIGRIEQRLAALGKTWADTTATQIYSVHPFPAEEFVRRGAAYHGLTWHYTRPPVQGLEFEVDCRSVPLEHHVEP